MVYTLAGDRTTLGWGSARVRPGQGSPTADAAHRRAQAIRPEGR